MPHPVLMHPAVELIDIEERLPARRLARVIGDPRTSPDAAHVSGALPEVEHPTVIELAPRDASVGIQNIHDLRAVAGVGRIPLEGEIAAAVLRLDPGERLLTVDLR